MYTVLYRRQTPALDRCPYVHWSDYNWHNIIQCNPYHDGIKIPWNPAVYCIIAATHGVALYMSLELLLRIFRRFKQWNALYPWALTFAAFGQIGLVITCDLSIWVLKPGNPGWTALNIISSISWNTGFALVLYSRLHVIVPKEHRLVRRAILVLIIFDAIAFQTPSITATIIGTYGSQRLAYDISKHAIYIDIGYAGQDILLSSLYIFYFWRYMRDGTQHFPQQIRKELKKTFILLALADSVVLVTVALSLSLLIKFLLLARYTMLPILNVFNLQIEFFVLNRLAETANLKNSTLQRGNLSNNDVCDLEVSITGQEEGTRIRHYEGHSPPFGSRTKSGGSISCYGHDPSALRDAAIFEDPGSSNLEALERQYLGNSR